MQQASIHVFDSFEALRAFAPQLSAAGSADFFFTLDWFETLAGNGLDIGTGMLLLLAADEQSGASFCLPLIRGKTLASLSNYYSSLYGPIGEGDKVPLEVWRAICRLIRSDVSRWPIIDLQPVDGDSPFCRNLLAALRSEGYHADTYFHFGNWYLDVAGRSFDTYFASLPSRLIHTIERGRKKLNREREWQLEIHGTLESDIEAAIADFETVYQHSWKQPEPYPQFIASLCRMAFRNGWLRLGVLRLGATPIAAQIWLVKDGKALIYKLAYDQDRRRYSPGSILTAALMQHAIDVDDVQQVDYLTGDDAYKRDWMSHRRERVGIIAFNPCTLRGLAAAGKHFIGKALKSFRKPQGLPSPT